MIPLTLVTGFLGSGKTTLLKQIIEQNRKHKFVYLINEFSPADIDGALINNETADTVAIPGGSIFCKCLVTQFISQLKRIPERFGDENSPVERVVIEASGIADPKVIRKMLRETHLDETYSLQSVITIVDPQSLLKLLHTLPNIRSQIEAANLIIINKTDRASESAISETETAVNSINSFSTIIKTSYCKIKNDILDHVSDSIKTAGDYAMCRDPRYSILLLRDSSVTIDRLRAAIQPVSADIYRLKGFIVTKSDIYYIDYSASGWEVTSSPFPVRKTGISVIVKGENRKKVLEHFRKLNLL